MKLRVKFNSGEENFFKTDFIQTGNHKIIVYNTNGPRTTIKLNDILFAEVDGEVIYRSERLDIDLKEVVRMYIEFQQSISRFVKECLEEKEND